MIKYSIKKIKEIFLFFTALILLSCVSYKNIIEAERIEIYKYSKIESPINTGGLFAAFKNNESNDYITLSNDEIQQFKRFIFNAKKRKTFPYKLGRELLFGRIVLKDSEMLLSISGKAIFDITNGKTYSIVEKDMESFNKLVEKLKKGNTSNE